MIVLEAKYRHRARGFEVIVAAPQWWDVAPADKRRDLVLVSRIGMHNGRGEWLGRASSFERLYEIAA